MLKQPADTLLGPQKQRGKITLILSEHKIIGKLKKKDDLNYARDMTAFQTLFRRE